MGTLRRSDDTGLTLYAILRDASHQVVIQATGAVEAYNSANWGTYDHAATEQGASGYYYVTTSGSIPAGIYWLEWKYQAGGSPTVSDTVRASGSGYWSGTAWLSTTVDLGTIGGVAPATAIAAGVDASALAGKFAGITLVAKWLRGLFRKDTMDATAKSEVNNGGGTFDEAADSNEAIRDRGDAAWTTGTGTSTLGAQAVRDAMKLAPTAGTPAAGSVDKHLDDAATALAVVGDTVLTITCQVGGTPVDGVVVRLSTDITGTNIIAGPRYSDSSGEATFYVDQLAEYYVWRQKAPINFTNPTKIVWNSGSSAYEEE